MKICFGVCAFYDSLRSRKKVRNKGSWESNFNYCGRVACAPTIEPLDAPNVIFIFTKVRLFVKFSLVVCASLLFSKKHFSTFPLSLHHFLRKRGCS